MRFDVKRLLHMAIVVMMLSAVLIAQSSSAEAQGSQNSFVILLDVSGSMGDPSSADPSQEKLEVALSAIDQALSSVDNSVQLGLRTFSGCSTNDTTLLASVAPADAAHVAGIRSNLNGVTANGETNISNALLQAVDDLPATSQRTILLVSDGEDTCDTDPCATASAIIASGVDVRVNTIGFETAGISDAEAELQCIAQSTGGEFESVDNLGALLAAIDVAVGDDKVCVVPYLEIQNMCRSVNTGTTAADLLAYECPPAPFLIIENMTSIGGITKLDSCVYIPLFCDGQVGTIDLSVGATPTSGDDVIIGTAGPDIIDALAGDDVICAGDGDDVVVGGTGNDTVIGAGGRDVLRGGPGTDKLLGGPGPDRLLGGTGEDELVGGADNDFLGGFGGDDVIDGGAGNDVIFGGFGADTISGGTGDDRIRGLVGDDTISGGAGNDQLDGDRGNDDIRGGAGNDVIRGGNAGDVLLGDDGNDDLSGGKADDIMSGGNGIDVCTGNAQFIADSADSSCETVLGVP